MRAFCVNYKIEKENQVSKGTGKFWANPEAMSVGGNLRSEET